MGPTRQRRLCLPRAMSLVLYRAKPTTSDSGTHCRKCGYILRGFSEPRCPVRGTHRANEMPC